MPNPRVNRTMGIEIEMSSSRIRRETIFEKLKPIVESEGHILTNQEAGNCWTLKSDGSCGYEVTTPALRATANNFEKLYRIIREFRRSIAGSNVINRQCGLHVHFCIREFNENQIKNVINTFMSYEDVLLSLQPSSRHQNIYSERIKSNSSLNRFLNSHSFSIHNIPITGHYYGLNFGRYSQRKTIEIRYGAGSVRERKIVNWAQILLFLIEFSKRSENAIHTDKNLEDLKTLIRETETHSWLDERRLGLSSWVQRRYDELHNREEETAEEA